MERRKGEQRNFNVVVSVSRRLPKKSNYYHSSSASSLSMCVCIYLSTLQLTGGGYGKCIKGGFGSDTAGCFRSLITVDVGFHLTLKSCTVQREMPKTPT